MRRISVSVVVSKTTEDFASDESSDIIKFAEPITPSIEKLANGIE